MADPAAPFDSAQPLSQLTGPIRVDSRLLGEIIWIVPDGYSGPGPGSTSGETVYTASECRLLLRCAADERRHVHRIKSLFDGEILEGADRAAGPSFDKS